MQKPLITTEKISIVHKVLVLKEMQGEVAQEYRIKLYTVSRLVNKARKNPKFLQELKAKQVYQERSKTRSLEFSMNLMISTTQ